MMTGDVDVITKRGRGRPSKLSALPGIPAHSRQSLEQEEERLNRQEAEIREARGRVTEKKEKLQTRCNILLGEGLRQLAETDAVSRDVCARVIGRIEKPEDRDLVMSWVPGAESLSFPPVESPSAAVDGKRQPGDKKSERRGVVADPALASSETMSSPILEEHAPKAAELPFQTPPTKRSIEGKGVE